MCRGWSIGGRTDPIALSGGAIGEALPNTLFPLPYFGQLIVDTSLKARCRRAAQRYARLHAETDETLWSLKWLSGCAGSRGDHSDGRIQNSHTTVMQSETQGKVLKMVSDFVLTDEAPEASLREVLRGTGSDGDCYAAGGELPQGALASFSFSKLVLSDDLCGAPMATCLLPEKVADRLDDVKRMQR